MMKQTIGIIGFAIVLSSFAFFPLYFLPTNDLELLETKQERIEILITSRSFIVGNPHYEPENMTAKVGTIIEWVNVDLVNHTVTNDEGIQGKLEGQIFDSGPIPPRSEFLLDTSRLLDDVYRYHCTIHPWSRGILTLVTEPISVATDKRLYNVGERVRISGIASIPALSPDPSTLTTKNLVNATRVNSVVLEVFTSENELFLTTEVPTINSGRYSYSFLVQDPGKYTVKATVDDFSASTVFEVRQLSKEKVMVEGIKFEDANGKLIELAKVGEKIFIKTEIENMLQANQDYVYAVQVKDSNQVTVLLAWKNSSVAPLARSTPAAAWTPESEGTYNVEIFVWSSMIDPEPLSTQVGETILVIRK